MYFLQELLQESENDNPQDAHLAFQGEDGIATDELWDSAQIRQMAVCGWEILVGVQNSCNREKETEHMKPKIRMVGLDLDGTVFNNNKEITTHTRSVLKEAIHQGCIVLPATGRPEIGLPGAFLEIPGVEYALTSNGARIIRIPSGETVYEELIPWEVALQVIEVMKQWAGESCNWETYFAGNIYVEEETYHFVKHGSGRKRSEWKSCI